METIKDAASKMHVLVCTNQREEGKQCCHKVGGHEVFTELKSRVRDAGLTDQCRVTRTGCLGYCNDKGTTITIHWPGVRSEWLTEVTREEVDTIWQKIRG